MSLLREQSTFLLHVAELIQKASELGFHLSGGELYRTSEQQALHVKNGRSTTMNSQHLKRLAVDLNFFRAMPDGELKLTYDVEELRPLGQFWEGLDAANRWGGTGPRSRTLRTSSAGKAWRRLRRLQRTRAPRLCPLAQLCRACTPAAG